MSKLWLLEWNLISTFQTGPNGIVKPSQKMALWNLDQYIYKKLTGNVTKRYIIHVTDFHVHTIFQRNIDINKKLV